MSSSAFQTSESSNELEGRDRHENVEVMIEHYRGAYAAAKAQAGFT